MVLDSSTADAAPEAAAVWLAFAIALATGAPASASPVLSHTHTDWQKAYQASVSVWKELKQKKRGLKDTDLDELVRIADRGFLSAYVYLTHFDDQPSAGFQDWLKQNRATVVQFIREFELRPAPVEDARDKSAPDHHPTASFQDGRALRARPAPLIEPEKVRLTAEREKVQQSISMTSGKTDDRSVAVLMMSYARVSAISLQLGQFDEAAAAACAAYEMSKTLPGKDGIAVAAARCLELLPFSADQNAIRTASSALDSLESAVTPERLSRAFALASRVARRQHDPEAAVPFAERAWVTAHASKDTAAASAARAELFFVYRDLWRSLSWNLHTGREREGSEADFVNDREIGTGPDKYGRRSPEEDSATFATRISGECQGVPEDQTCPLLAHVRREMNDGNLVPALKYAYYREVEPVYSYVPDDQEPVTINGVLVPSSDLNSARTAASRGDFGPAYKLLLRVGTVLPEEVEGKPTNFYRPDTVTLEQVEAARQRIVGQGGYVPEHVNSILQLMRRALLFAKENGFQAPKTAGSGLVQ